MSVIGTWKVLNAPQPRRPTRGPRPGRALQGEPVQLRALVEHVPRRRQHRPPSPSPAGPQPSRPGRLADVDLQAQPQLLALVEPRPLRSGVKEPKCGEWQVSGRRYLAEGFMTTLLSTSIEEVAAPALMTA